MLVVWEVDLGPHKYAYVHGDPIQGVDPSGKFLGSLVIGTLNYFNINTRKSSADVAAGGNASLAIWAAVTKHSLNLWTYFTLGTQALALLFQYMQGPLSGAIARTYARRGSYGLTGAGQVYTRLFDDGYEFVDDGSMRTASSDARKYWYYLYAKSQGMLEKRHVWYQPQALEFVDTNERVNLTETFWVGGLHSFEAKGQYFIRVIDESDLAYTIEVEQVRVHWVGTDRADNRAAAEKEESLYRYALEATFGFVGDIVLGADFRFAVHDMEATDDIQRLMIWKADLGNR